MPVPGFKLVARALEAIKNARDGRMVDGFVAVIDDQILLADISNIIAVLFSIQKLLSIVVFG